MPAHAEFETAIALLESGDVDGLRELLQRHPDLAAARDDGNASLLIRLIDYPGHRPRAAETAAALLQAGVDVDARRDDENGTALAGALCTHEFELVPVLLEAGADVHAPLGWMPGTVFDLADRMCQDLGRQRDENFKMLAKLVSQAAGHAVPSRPPIGGTLPLIFVADVEAAIRFYTEVLGFHVDWRYEESDCEPYIGMSRGGAEFHLAGCRCPDKRHVGNLWVRVECDLIDQLFADIKEGAGVTILTEPTDQPWGFRELDIEDPDGNRFTFFGPTLEEN